MTFEPTRLRGDIWLAGLGNDPADPEQAFIRPVLIVSDKGLHHASFGMVVIVPATSTIRDIALHVIAEPDTENGLTVASAFQTEQVRSISTRRLHARIGRLGVAERHVVDELLRTVLTLP